ncbi:cyclin-dependent kinase inhibitor 5-like [Telopea speciosissima]|uniref:cyclin-dependent kinase inhibitor 5-like n=1 Tax=Telopea speciosissima TaxID=54955 RepID=UPI001CC67A60|nr:cyclin-dependent kinase inhibitor 5-like [Telopea speciosissima]XP_043707300.1 cyclin-dependent kinase inhibitor 5-like [Telopea speciosissima]
MLCKLKRDMGKYMRKAKITGEVAVMEVAQSSLGVRTRAKTLALQRLQKSTTASMVDSGASYLQLRSRRLEKPPLLAASNHEAKKQQNPPLPRDKEKESAKANPNPNSPTSSRLVADSGNSCSVASVSCSKYEEEFSTEEKTPVAIEVVSQDNNLNNNDGGIEASFGENVLENEGRERSTRETTPCSLIRDSDTIGTPGSTTRPTNSTATNRRVQNAMRRIIPTAHEMEEFFAGAEQQQQRLFTEKYNFDPVNDKPLPGRYEWVRVKP